MKIHHVVYIVICLLSLFGKETSFSKKDDDFSDSLIPKLKTKINNQNLLEINLSYKSNIIDYEYEYKNVENLNILQTSSNLKVSMNCLTIIGNISIKAVLEDRNVINTKYYTFNFKNKNYISDISEDDVFSIAYKDSYDKGLITKKTSY